VGVLVKVAVVRPRQSRLAVIGQGLAPAFYGEHSMEMNYSYSALLEPDLAS